MSRINNISAIEKVLEMISAMIVISVLMVLKPITWVVLGLGALLTIMIAIGIYLFDKHYLN